VGERRGCALAQFLAWFQHAREEGVDAGRLAALRHAVLAVLAARNVAVPDDARARVEAVADVATLDRWLVAAATATDALR